MQKAGFVVGSGGIKRETAIFAARRFKTHSSLRADLMGLPLNE